MSKKYSEKDVTYFSNDIEKIRAKPNMYVGATDANGIFNIIREALDNAVDESRAGRNKLVKLVFDTKNQEAYVIDAGVGIPVKKHPKAKISTLTHIVSALQSSGKIKSEAYKNSIGTHGVGITAANALSEVFEVWTYRKDAGGWHHTKFEEGVEKSPVKKTKKLPKIAAKRGTIIKIKPSQKYFGKAKLDTKKIDEWCEITSFLNRGLEVSFVCDGKERKWVSKNGLSDYLDKQIKDLSAELIGKKPFVYTSPNVEIALAFTNTDGDNIDYYTNTVRNIEGGVHADAMLRALKASLKNYGPKLTYADKDLLDGVVGILNYNIDDAQYDSQTKEKLVDGRVKQACYDELLEAFTEYFRSNRTFAMAWVKRAAEIRKHTQNFLKNKKLVANVRKAKVELSTKLAAVSGKVAPEHCELFLVEGDSAGGSAKRARNNDTQAVFPLKGKPLNVMEAEPDKILANTEIATILAAIGVDIQSDDPTNKMPYGKIIFLADADADGKHINTLLLTVFWRFAPDLIRKGMVYSVKSPEYLGRYKNKTVFGSSRKSVLKKLNAPEGARVEVKHIKGWGEMDAEDLEIAAMLPGHRTLYQIQYPKDKKKAARFQALMGKKADFRKQLMGVD